MLQFISMEEAFAQIKARASSRRIPASQVPLEDTVGCVLAEPAVANLSIPPFNNSARDGIVLSPMGLTQSRGGSPISLAGELRAGDSVEAANGIQGDAARIMTGAPIPAWAEAVVMIEDLEFKDDGTVLVKKLPGAGAWIRPQGSDIAAGSVILNSGRRIIPEHVQALASSGIVDLVVYNSPRIGLCSTGEELVDVRSGPPGSGQIYDSNRPFMTAMIRSFGCDVVINEHVGDTLEEMVGFLNRVMDETLDLVV